jgi:hypothetical protein
MRIAMKFTRPAFVLASLFTFATFGGGCAKTPDTAILGVWTLDAEQTMPLLTQGPQHAANLMEVSSATLTYTFVAGGSVTVAYEYGTSEWTRDGQWTVGNVDGEKQYYRIEPLAAADWTGYSVYLRDGALYGPLGSNENEKAIFTN